MATIQTTRDELDLSRRQAARSLNIALTEFGNDQADLDRAFEYAEKALQHIGLARILESQIERMGATS